MATLDSKLSAVVGGTTASALAKHLDMATVADLIHHYPFRYAQRGERTDLDSLEIGEQATVLAQVRSVTSRPMRNRRGSMLEVVVSDDDGRTLSLTFFNQPWQTRYLKAGRWGLFSGKVTEFRGRRQLNGPDFRMLADPDDEETGEMIEEFAGALIPVYRAAGKVPTWTIARCVRVALDVLEPPDDPLPEAMRRQHSLIDFNAALHAIHRPESTEQLYAAKKRLKWQEAFSLQLTLVQRKARAATTPAVPRPGRADGLLAAFDANLPFELTDGQREVGEELSRALSLPHPMHRLLQGDVGAGKAQPLDSRVLTPSGFRMMGDLAVGDEVIAANGEVTTVVGVYPQGERDVYEVVISDGTRVQSDLEHLWAVNTTVRRHRGSPLKVLSLGEIRDDLVEANGSSKWHLPCITPCDLDDGGPRPLDPYVLGLLLGDGYLKNGRVGFSTADDQLVVELMKRLPRGNHLDKPSWARPYDWYVIGCRRGTNPALTALRELGVYGCDARTKHVPNSYLNAPVRVRHELLQGLLDSDGTLARHGSDVSFVSASDRLAKDLAWLVESLGGTARNRGVRKSGRSYHKVSLRLPNEYPPFRLKRKADLVRPRTKYSKPVRAIRAVEYVGRKPVQCISIAHHERLYVTDHFVPTHNTLVSVRAMLQVVDSRAQAVLLAPTEVLAAQHYRTILKQLGDLGRGGELGAPPEATRVTLVTGSLGAKAKREALATLADGSAGIVVGTHALLYEGVDFADLGLVVVDEQHRFGVEQRDALRAKASDPPHVLVMTATPIPRTVAMTVYGDLETSRLGQLPKGRSPIKTHVVPGTDERWVARAWQRVREEVGKGHQAYVVCPRVGDDDKADRADETERRAPLAVLDVGPRLADGPLSGLKLGILHGRMPPDEKDAVMARFSAGELDVLVATTVIEVGVDVPNATMMVIMDAERFGVSQLHQLRGRVGRGSAPGLCLLVTEANAASPSGERLEAVASTTDGFRLAELDLEQRREGDVLGDAQSGAKSHVRLLSLLRDAELIGQARAEAVEVIKADPELERHPRLAAAIAALVDDDRAEYLEKS